MTENIEQMIGKGAERRGWRLAVAESCTRGLIGHRITNNSARQPIIWAGLRHTPTGQKSACWEYPGIHWKPMALSAKKLSVKWLRVSGMPWPLISVFR